jgi:hypothetical protein
VKVIDFCPCCNSKNIEKTYGFIAPFVTNRIYGWPILSWPVSTLQSIFGDCLPLRILGKVLGRHFLVKMQTGVIVCSQCAFVCSDIRFDDDELCRYYADYMESTYLTNRITVEPRFASIASKIHGTEELTRRHAYMEDFFKKHLEGFLPNFERVLDYGGGDGAAIPEGILGHSIKTVFDVSDKPLRDGVERILSLKNEEPFDFVICSHVLEHVSSPTKVIDDILTVMKSKSWLYVELPGDLEGFQDLKPGQLTAQAFSGLLIHEHINHFSQAAVRHLLESRNLRVRVIESFPVDLMWVKQRFIRALAQVD